MSCNNGESKSETPVPKTWEWHKYLNLQLQQPTHTHSHKRAHTHPCHHRRSLWESMTVFFVKSSACGSYVMEAEFSPTYFGALLTRESGCKFWSCWSLFYYFFFYLRSNAVKKFPFMVCCTFLHCFLLGVPVQSHMLLVLSDNKEPIKVCMGIVLKPCLLPTWSL